MATALLLRWACRRQGCEGVQQGSKPVPAWNQAASLNAGLTSEKLDSQDMDQKPKRVIEMQRLQKGTRQKISFVGMI